MHIFPPLTYLLSYFFCIAIRSLPVSENPYSSLLSVLQIFQCDLEKSWRSHFPSISLPRFFYVFFVALLTLENSNSSTNIVFLKLETDARISLHSLSLPPSFNCSSGLSELKFLFTSCFPGLSVALGFRKRTLAFPSLIIYRSFPFLLSSPSVFSVLLERNRQTGAHKGGGSLESWMII